MNKNQKFQDFLLILVMGIVIIGASYYHGKFYTIHKEPEYVTSTR
jgi:hypothetical protein